MLCYKLSWFEIRTLALLEAVRFCKGEKILGALIGVGQTTISKWISNPKRRIPYTKAVLIEKYTGVSVERLMPQEKEVNDYLRDKYTKDKLNLSKNETIEKNSDLLPYFEPDRPLIIDTTGSIISGLVKLQMPPGVARIKVVVLDLEALFLEKQTLAELNTPFLLSERVSIGLSLEQLITNRCHLGDKIVGRIDEIVAKIIGLKSKDIYHYAKQVCSRGIPELIKALDNNQISIKKAVKIAKLSEYEQRHCIQTVLKGGIYESKDPNGKT